MLTAPGHTKTTTCILNGIVYDVLIDPNTREGLISRVDGVSERIGQAARDSLETEEIDWVFGPQRGSEDWGKESWTVRGRTRIFKEPTFAALSLKGQVLSGHYKRLYLDDIYQPEDQRTHSQRETVKGHFYQKASTRLADDEPDPTLFWVGVRVNPYDLAGEVEANDPHFRGNVMVLPALPDKGSWARKVFGPVLWHEVRTALDLIQQRQAMGPAPFNAQYQCDPKEMTGRLIQRRWLRPYELRAIDLSDLTVFVGVDLAAALDDTIEYEGDAEGEVPNDAESSKFATATIGIAHFHRPATEWRTFLLDCYTARLTLDEQVDAIRRANDRFLNRRRTFVESNGYQLVMAQHARSRGVTRVMPIHTTQGKPRGKGKTATIAGAPYQDLAARCQRGEFFVRPELEVAIQQLCDFPDEPNDIVDAIVIALRGALREPRPVTVPA